MSTRKELLASIATTIEDYRAGELAKPTPEHVDKWVSQFAKPLQLPMLREMDHVLKRTYFSLGRVVKFLRILIAARELVGDDPCSFWRRVNFLDIQAGGNSQTEMLALFSEILKEQCGFGIEACGGGPTYLYLDDVIFTGNRVRRDIERWIESTAPATARLEIVAMAYHSGGQYYANVHIVKAASVSKKTIHVRWWRQAVLEDRKSQSDSADVLRPTTIPDDAAVKSYVRSMKYAPTLRNPGGVGSMALFSSPEGKELLEQEFLKAGANIRSLCPNLGDTQRPLGHMTLDTLGFGSLIVTFRNCPNNAPLALWVGDPWYPLFARTTNSQTKIQRLFAAFEADDE